MADKTVTINVDANTGQAEGKINGLIHKIEQPVKLEVDADIKGAAKSIEELKNSLKALTNQTGKGDILRLNVAGINPIKKQLSELGDMFTKISEQITEVSNKISFDNIRPPQMVQNELDRINEQLQKMKDNADEIRKAETYINGQKGASILGVAFGPTINKETGEKTYENGLNLEDDYKQMQNFVKRARTLAESGINLSDFKIKIPKKVGDVDLPDMLSLLDVLQRFQDAGFTGMDDIFTLSSSNIGRGLDDMKQMEAQVQSLNVELDQARAKQERSFTVGFDVNTMEKITTAVDGLNKAFSESEGKTFGIREEDIQKITEAVSGLSESFSGLKLEEGATLGLDPSQIDAVTGSFQELKSVIEEIKNILSSFDIPKIDLKGASEEIGLEGDSAEKAAESKTKFVDANKKVADSGKQTAKGVEKAKDAIIADGNAAGESVDNQKKLITGEAYSKLKSNSFIFDNALNKEIHFDFEFDKAIEKGQELDQIIDQIFQENPNTNLDSIINTVQQELTQVETEARNFDDILKEIRQGSGKWSFNDLLNNPQGFAQDLNLLYEQLANLQKLGKGDTKEALNLETRIQHMLAAQSKLLDPQYKSVRSYFDDIQKSLSKGALSMEDKMWEAMANGGNLTSKNDFADLVSSRLGLNSSKFLSDQSITQLQHVLNILQNIDAIREKISDGGKIDFFNKQVQDNLKMAEGLKDRLIGTSAYERESDQEWVDNQYKNIAEYLQKAEEYKKKIADIRGESYEMQTFTAEQVKSSLASELEKAITPAERLKVAMDFKHNFEFWDKLKDGKLSSFAQEYKDLAREFHDFTDEEAGIKRIQDRLKEIYSYRNEDNFQNKYGNEVVTLMDFLTGAGADTTGNKTIDKFLKNADRFKEARDLLSDFSNLIGKSPSNIGDELKTWIGDESITNSIGSAIDNIVEKEKELFNFKEIIPSKESLTKNLYSGYEEVGQTYDNMCQQILNGSMTAEDAVNELMQVLSKAVPNTAKKLTKDGLEDRYNKLFTVQNTIDELTRNHPSEDTYHDEMPIPNYDILMNKEGLLGLIQEYYKPDKAMRAIQDIKYLFNEMEQLQNNSNALANAELFREEFSDMSFGKQLAFFDEIANDTKQGRKNFQLLQNDYLDMVAVMSDGTEQRVSLISDLGDPFSIYREKRGDIKSFKISDIFGREDVDNELDQSLARLGDAIQNIVQPISERIHQSLAEAFNLDDNTLTKYFQTMQKWQEKNDTGNAPLWDEAVDSVIDNREKALNRLSQAYHNKLKNTGAPQELISTYNDFFNQIKNGDSFSPVEEMISALDTKAKELGITFDETSKKWVQLSSSGGNGASVAESYAQANEHEAEAARDAAAAEQERANAAQQANQTAGQSPISFDTTALPEQEREAGQAGQQMGEQIADGAKKANTALTELFQKFTIGNIKSLNIGELLGYGDVKDTDIYKDLQPVYDIVRKITRGDISKGDNKITIPTSNIDGEPITDDQLQKIERYKTILHALGYEIGELDNNHNISTLSTEIIPTENSVKTIDEIINALIRLNAIKGQTSNETPVSEGTTTAPSPDKIDAETKAHEDAAEAAEKHAEAARQANEAEGQKPTQADTSNSEAQTQANEQEARSAQQAAEAEKERANAAKQANQTARQATATATSSENIGAEASTMESLQTAVTGVTEAVNAKTEAFSAEQSAVSSAIQAEIASLESLKQTLSDIKQSVSDMGEAFNSIGKDNPFTSMFDNINKNAEALKNFADILRATKEQQEQATKAAEASKDRIVNEKAVNPDAWKEYIKNNKTLVDELGGIVDVREQTRVAEKSGEEYISYLLKGKTGSAIIGKNGRLLNKNILQNDDFSQHQQNVKDQYKDAIQAMKDYGKAVEELNQLRIDAIQDKPVDGDQITVALDRANEAAQRCIESLKTLDSLNKSGEISKRQYDEANRIASETQKKINDSNTKVKTASNNQEYQDQINIIQKAIEARNEYNKMLTNETKGYTTPTDQRDAIVSNLEATADAYKNAIERLKELQEEEKITAEQFNTADQMFGQGTKASQGALDKAYQDKIEKQVEKIQRYQTAANKAETTQNKFNVGDATAKQVQNAVDRMNELKAAAEEAMSVLEQMNKTEGSSKFIPDDTLNKYKQIMEQVKQMNGLFTTGDRTNAEFATIERGYQTLMKYADQYTRITEKQRNGEALSFNDLQFLTKYGSFYQDAANNAGLFEDAQNKAADSMKKFQETMNNSDTAAFNETLQKMGQTLAELGKGTWNKLGQEALEKLNTQYENLVKSTIDYKNSSKEVQAQMRSDAQSVVGRMGQFIDYKDQGYYTTAGEKSVAALDAKMATWQFNNSAATGAVQQIDKLRASLEGISPGRLEEVNAEFERIKASAASAGTLGKSFGDSLKKSFMGLGRYLATYTSFYRVIGTIKSAVNMVKELDSALMEVRKVSAKPLSELKEWQKGTFEQADEVGTTGKQLQQSTAAWLRLGKSFSESQEAAKASSWLLNVSEFKSIDDATTALVSMKQAYNDLSFEDIIDKLNNVGDHFSSATDQLASGLQNAGAVLKTQGNDIDKSLALLTAGNDITQDMSFT